LRPDWKEGQVCYINYNNRAIWSDQSSLEETKNNWLVYRPANLYDFPKGFGDLEAIDRLESRTVMVRYTNHFQLYNALATVDTGALTAVLGTGALFSGSQPVDTNTTDIGWAGAQNKMLVNCEQGHIWIDAKRGKVLLLRGTSVEELSGPKYLNSKYFIDNLPFQILQYFPTIDTDNNFNGIGLHGVYDDFYKRLIITKLDWVPLPDTGMQFDGTNFYIEKTITINAPSQQHELMTCCPEGSEMLFEYSGYEDRSNNLFMGCSSGFEESFVPPISCHTDVGIPGTNECCPEGYTYIGSLTGYDITKDSMTTTVFNSCYQMIPVGGYFEGTYIPPEYCPVSTSYTEKTIIELGDPAYFCSKCLTMSFSFLSNSWISWHSYFPNYYVEHENFFQSGYNSGTADVWDHNSVFNLFGNYRGQQYSYILEYPFIYKEKDQLLQWIEEYATVLRYTDFTIYTEPDQTIYFTNVVIYNNQASTGLLNLIPKDINNQASYQSYPRYNTNSVDILVTKVLHNYSYNMIWNNLKNVNTPMWIPDCTPEEGQKTLNQSNFDYGVKSFRKFPLMAKDCKVRSIMRIDRNPYKIISKFALTKTQDKDS